MSEDVAAYLVISAMFGAPLFIAAFGILWIEWMEAGVEYAELLRRRRIWARVVLSAPLWIWWAIFPALAVAALVGAGVGLRALWRMGFVGRAPSDGPTPSEGAYR